MNNQPQSKSCWKIIIAICIFFEYLVMVPLGGELGVVKTFEFRGPFTSSGYPSVYVIDLPDTSSRFVNYYGDSIENPSKSNGQIFINKLSGEGNVVHSEISQEPKSGFFRYSHWKNSIYFSLPNQLKNSNDIKLEVIAPGKLHPNLKKFIYLVIFFQLMALIFLDATGKRIVNNESARKKIINIDLKSFKIFLTIIISSIGLLVGVLLFQLAGYNNDYIYKLVNSKAISNLAEFHERLPIWCVLLIVYFLLFKFILRRFFRIELLANRSTELWKIFILILCYLWVDYFFLWNGLSRISDLSSSSVAGIVPFNDAHGHFIQPYLVYFNGVWDTTGSRRPVAAALRTGITAIAGFDLFIGILFQSALFAGALTFLNFRLRGFIGELSCYLITCLLLIIGRPYLQTFLTESLAISIYVIAGTLIFKSLKTDKFSDSVWGLFFCIIAELVRPGNIFMIPIVIAWVIWRGCNEGKTKILIPLLVVGAIFSMSSLIQNSFGSKGGGFGSNFGEILCGAIHNEDWTYCSRHYKKELDNYAFEAQKNNLLLKISLDKLISSPDLFYKRIISTNRELIDRVPKIIAGIEKISMPKSIQTQLISMIQILLLFGVFYAASERGKNTVLMIIWIISLIFSSSIIYFDDGTRTMVGVWIYLVFLIGISSSKLLRNKFPEKQSSLVESYNVERLILFSYLMILAACFGIKAGFLTPYFNSPNYLQNDEMESYSFGFIVSDSYKESRMFKFQITGENFEKIIKNSWIRQYQNVESYRGLPFIFYVNVNKNGGATLQTIECNHNAKFCEGN